MDRTRIGVALAAFALAAGAATLAGADAQDVARRSEVAPTSRRYAIVEGGVVTNVVAWDGASPWAPPEGAQLVEITADKEPERCQPSSSWDGARFAPPDRAAEVAAAKVAARADAIRLTAEADAAASLAATATGAERAALLADETRLRAEAAAALARSR